jgi:tetratricopeptide (TPR) repeat protein
MAPYARPGGLCTNLLVYTVWKISCVVLSAITMLYTALRASNAARLYMILRQLGILGLVNTLITLLWLVGLPSQGRGAAQTDCQEALQDYRVALKSYEDGLFDPALASFETYLRRCPGGEYTTQTHYLLGTIYYQRQRFPEALQHVLQVLSGTTNTNLHPSAALIAGQAHFQLGQPEKARAYLQRATTAGVPAEVRQAAWYWLGEIALQQQRYDEAWAHYERLLGEHRTGSYAIQAYYSLGWLARQRGDAPAALDAFTEFLKLAPHHEFAPQVRFIRAELLRETARLPEAAEAFKQLAQNPSAPLRDEALFWWAETVNQQGRYDEARTLYQRLVTEYPHSARLSASLYGWGWTAIQQHQCATAVPPWERLLQQDPAFPQALTIHYQLGVCSIHLEQPARAREHLQQVIEAGEATPYFYDALGRLAAIAFAQREYADAIRYYTRLLPLARQEEVARVHYLLGEAYAALGKPDGALAHWQQASAGHQPTALQAQALYRISSAYVRQQAWEKALPVLQQLWENFPAFPERAALALQLAQAYSATQRCAEALTVYDALIDTTAARGEQRLARTAKAFCLFELGRYAEVTQTLSPLLSAYPSVPVEARELYVFGQAHMQLRQYDEALGAFTLLQQHFPTDALTVAAEPSLAFLLERAGRHGDALAVWRTYLRRDQGGSQENLPQFQLHAGRLAFKEGHFPEALDYLAPVRETPAGALAAEALFWSAEVYFQQQQWDLAHQVYQELLDRHMAEQQWSALARLRLGMIYEQQQEWDRALHAYRLLLTVTTDAEVMAHARQRIAAIEAGRVHRLQVPSTRLSDG